MTYSMAVGTGISYFQYTNIDSGRNVFIVGFTMFMGLLVPKWLFTTPGSLATGAVRQWQSYLLIWRGGSSAPVWHAGGEEGSNVEACGAARPALHQDCFKMECWQMLELWQGWCRVGELAQGADLLLSGLSSE